MGGEASGRTPAHQARPEGDQGLARAVAAAPGPGLQWGCPLWSPERLTSTPSGKWHRGHSPASYRAVLENGVAWDRAGMGEVTQSQVGAGRLGWIRAGVGAAREQGGGQREGRVQAEGVVAPLWPRPPQPRSQRAPALARSPRCLAPSSCLPPAHSADSMRRQTKSLLERVAASIRFEERIDPRGPWARPAAPPGIRLGLAPRGQPIAVQTLDVVSSSFITASPLMFEKQGSFVFYIEYFHHA